MSRKQINIGDEPNKKSEKIAGASSVKKPSVSARDYTAAEGYSDAVDWDGKSVVVGGRAITPDYIVNGKAYVNEAQLTDAISDMEKRNGILGADEVSRRYEDKFGNLLENAAADLSDIKPFSYNPDDDPVYAAYKEQYTREGDRAYRRVLNDNNSSVTGASGAVLSEAIAARDDYSRRLADMIPTLAKDAYERHIGDMSARRDNFDVLADAANEYFDNLHGSDIDRIKLLNDSHKNERSEQQRWINNARQEKLDYYDNAKSEQDLERGRTELSYLNDSLYEGNRKTRLENDRAEVDNAMSAAVSRGFFTRSDEEALPWLRGYRGMYGGYTVSPWEAQARYEYDIAHSKALASYHASWGM